MASFFLPQALDAVQADLDALSSCCEAMGGSLAGSRAAAADLLHDTDRLTRALQVRLAAAAHLERGLHGGSGGHLCWCTNAKPHQPPAPLARWLQQPAVSGHCAPAVGCCRPMFQPCPSCPRRASCTASWWAAFWSSKQLPSGTPTFNHPPCPPPHRRARRAASLWAAFWSSTS